MPPNDAAGIGAARLWGYSAPVRASLVEPHHHSGWFVVSLHFTFLGKKRRPCRLAKPTGPLGVTRGRGLPPAHGEGAPGPHPSHPPAPPVSTAVNDRKLHQHQASGRGPPDHPEHKHDITHQPTAWPAPSLRGECVSIGRSGRGPSQVIRPMDPVRHEDTTQSKTIHRTRTSTTERKDPSKPPCTGSNSTRSSKLSAKRG